MAKMRAKMRVETVTRNGHSEVLKLNAVYGGTTNNEDNSFAKTTPNATLDMTIANKELHGQFNPGDTFYVDFTPVPAQV